MAQRWRCVVSGADDVIPIIPVVVGPPGYYDTVHFVTIKGTQFDGSPVLRGSF